MTVIKVHPFLSALASFVLCVLAQVSANAVLGHHSNSIAATTFWLIIPFVLLVAAIVLVVYGLVTRKARRARRGVA
jgi:heme/copper-type cytochrome/quinol oxidase subunit 2